MSLLSLRGWFLSDRATRRMVTGVACVVAVGPGSRGAAPCPGAAAAPAGCAVLRAFRRRIPQALRSPQGAAGPRRLDTIRALHVPVGCTALVVSNANLAALGEARFGAVGTTQLSSDHRGRARRRALFYGLFTGRSRVRGRAGSCAGCGGRGVASAGT